MRYFFCISYTCRRTLNELSPAPTTLRALRELFDFDVRKSSAAFVTRSVLVRLEIVLPSYDVDATRFDAILVLALAESCDAGGRHRLSQLFLLVSSALTNAREERRLDLSKNYTNCTRKTFSRFLFLSFLRKPLR